MSDGDPHEASTFDRLRRALDTQPDTVDALLDELEAVSEWDPPRARRVVLMRAEVDIRRHDLAAALSRLEAMGEGPSDDAPDDVRLRVAQLTCDALAAAGALRRLEAALARWDLEPMRRALYGGLIAERRGLLEQAQDLYNAATGSSAPGSWWRLQCCLAEMRCGRRPQQAAQEAQRLSTSFFDASTQVHRARAEMDLRAARYDAAASHAAALQDSDDPRALLIVARLDVLLHPDTAPYQRLERLKQLAGRLGQAGVLADTHLLMAECAPRVDFRARHVEHAANLFDALGDVRGAARAKAAEAQLELDFGELSGAEELADEAIRTGTASNEPRASALGWLVQGVVWSRLRASGDPAPERSLAEALAIAQAASLGPLELHALVALDRLDEAEARARELGLPPRGWGIG